MLFGRSALAGSFFLPDHSQDFPGSHRHFRNECAYRVAHRCSDGTNRDNDRAFADFLGAKRAVRINALDDDVFGLQAFRRCAAFVFQP